MLARERVMAMRTISFAGRNETMYGLSITDPARESIGSPLDLSSHLAASGTTQTPNCGQSQVAGKDSIARSFWSGKPSPSNSFGSGTSPAAIMAAFTAFVQQLFAQIASWMQGATFAGSGAAPTQPRYLVDGSRAGGLPPAGP
jgi:hypothetical protein